MLGIDDAQLMKKREKSRVREKKENFEKSA